MESAYALHGSNLPKAGGWRMHYGFPPTAPLILDIGCGKGEFTTYLAQKKPAVLVIGLDRRADRLATGCRLAEKLSLKNVFFWHGDALTLDSTFVSEEVSEIWLNYPDPYPKRRQEKHRLVHPRYLRQYWYILKGGGKIHFRTDDEALYAYALEQFLTGGWQILQATPDLREGGIEEAFFETEFRKRKGGYIRYIEVEKPLLPAVI
ncbi:MAG: tRNA (guanosine(46)-N7)-methyltransferase TrmB [Bacteroidia bacterium]|nr:tRNA (guanosine(46)-N7)-methyltransferase TrmB [Bacteroidia bacterium]